MPENGDLEDLDRSSERPPESSNRVLENSGGLIYGPYGPVASIGPHRQPPERHELDGMRWWHCRLEWLIWTDVAARAFLSGALVSDVLGTEHVLLGGQHRPPWHPIPGVDLADLAYVSNAPGNMLAADLMLRLVATIRR